MRENGIARLPSSVYTEQVNIKVEPELKQRLRALKLEKRIDVSEESRKALEAMVKRLEQLASA